MLSCTECNFHAFADDNSIWNEIDPSSLSDILARISELEQTLEMVKQWMFENKLCLNESKTECIVFGKTHLVQQADIQRINIGTAEIRPSKSVRNLGVTLDSEMSFHEHISKLSSCCYYQLNRAWRIRRYLTIDAAATLMIATVISRLDYCNSILVNTTKKEIKKMQKIQNAAARYVTCCDRRTPMTPILKQLHWLPVEYRIRHKLLTIVHKCVYGQAPEYLKDLIEVYTPARQLRSADAKLLTVPRINLPSIGSRAFSVAGPTEWNALPKTIRETTNLKTFKKTLKTHLFNVAFN